LIKGGKTEVVRISLGDFSIERQKILGKNFTKPFRDEKQ